jgi:hypothetical protein
MGFVSVRNGVEPVSYLKCDIYTFGILIAQNEFKSP